MTEQKKKKRKTAEVYREDWLDRKWRPAMGWMYLVVCITDFIIFPVLHSWMQVRYGTPTIAWDPLTLKGGGLFHVAMGAVLGVAAWSRGQEKITKYETGYYDRHNYDDGYGNDEYYEHEETMETRPLVPVTDHVTHTETADTQFYRYRR